MNVDERIFILILRKCSLSLFFPMFPFDPPESIRKPKVLFSGGSKGNNGKKRVKMLMISNFCPMKMPT